MSGRQRPRPEVRPCRLCGDLAQPTIHFDADWWKAIKAAAERELAEYSAEIANADKHLRMLSTPLLPMVLALRLTRWHHQPHTVAGRVPREPPGSCLVRGGRPWTER